MSRKGIFSIASGGGSKDSSTPEVSADSSPFGQADEASTGDSPFVRDPEDENSAQAMGEDEPFKMNGFGQADSDEGEQADEAGDSPFRSVGDHQDHFEAAKANLEPQQDFAAVSAPFKPAVASIGDDAGAASSENEQTAAANDESGTAAGVSIEQPVAEVPPAAPAPFQVPSSPVPVPQHNTSAAPGMEQLEIRAIFGVDHALDANEMIQRARSLSGIGTVARVAGQEKQALSDFRSAVKSLGLGDPDQMEINFGSGSVDFIVEGGATLAVLQQGPYAPGVKETLIIVARELDKLG